MNTDLVVDKWKCMNFSHSHKIQHVTLHVERTAAVKP